MISAVVVIKHQYFIDDLTFAEVWYRVCPYRFHGETIFQSPLVVIRESEDLLLCDFLFRILAIYDLHGFFQRTDTIKVGKRLKIKL